MRRKLQPPASLESFLLKLGNAPVKGDKLHRKRLEILARTLWSRALQGDKRSVELLLDRLPAQPVPPEPVPNWREHDMEHDVGDPFMATATLIKSLIESGILPIEAYNKFVPAEVTEQTTKTEQ